MNKPHVKICGLTRPEDAHLAALLGADFLGTILYANSPRAVPSEQLDDLLAAIPGGKRVMVDVNPASDELEHKADRGFDCFQIHCDVDTPVVSVATWAGIVGRERLWLAPRIPPGEPFPQAALEFADTFLIDTYSKTSHGGTGRTGDWERFAQWQLMYPHKRLILSGGLNAQNIPDALAATQATTIDLSSSLESSPGIKDPAKLRELFRTLATL